ncbi:MAG TPA: PepSY domain-containing protein [Methylophilus sp.]|nr:PepSY domain-containing protein [Methylophilus sp.]
MKNHTKTLIGVFLSGLVGLSLHSNARTGEAQKEESVLLSGLVEKVAAENIGVVSEAEYEKGRWEIEACTATSCVDIKFDAKTGTEIKRKTEKSDDALPPDNARPLAEIVKTFEEHHYQITEIEFEDGVSEVYWIKDDRKVKSWLDPVTAKNVYK